MQTIQFPVNINAIPVIETDGTVRILEAGQNGEDFVITPEQSMMLQEHMQAGKYTANDATLASIILPNMEIILHRFQKRLH